MTNDGKSTLKGIELDLMSFSRPRPLDLPAIRAKVFDSLKSYLKQRLELANADLLSTIQPFTQLDTSKTDITKVHELIGKDLDLTTLHLQFRDLSTAEDVTAKNMTLPQLILFIASPERVNYFRETAIVMARILACTPHSADVERCGALITC